jgi:ammonia channel protein AmtB
VCVPIFKWVYGGWLGQRGSIDFAGGTVIQVNAGLVATTPAAGFVSGAAPLWIGGIAGVVCCSPTSLPSSDRSASRS